MHDTHRYKIGTVARLTGISPDTLRVWERRYQAVKPGRSAGGDREYSRQDIERLQLIRQLLDGGDAIGTIAGLSTDRLIERTMQAGGAARSAGQGPRAPCRAVVVGETLAARLQAEAAGLEGLVVISSCLNIEGCLSEPPPAPVDVLVIEVPTLLDDTTGQIIRCLDDSGARKALVVYRYATSRVLQNLPAARVHVVRAPVTSQLVRDLCISMLAPPVATAHAGTQGARGLSVEPRRYSNEALAKLARLSTTVKCECPKHLAELITDLVAFERYSAECESRHLKDAALHAYLHATASHARNLIEDALAHVVELEGIQIDD